MLALDCNANESILLRTTDGVVEVSVTQIKDGQVKLGVDAPETVQVSLGEAHQSDWRSRKVMSPSVLSSLRFSKF